METTISPREAHTYPEPLITKKALSTLLSVSERWIEYRMGDGLPFLKLGNSPRYSYSQVLDWVREHQEQAR